MATKSRVELPAGHRAAAERGRARLDKLAYGYPETGELLSVSERSVRRLVQAGRLHAVKLNGGRVVITADSIAALLAGGGLDA